MNSLWPSKKDNKVIPIHHDSCSNYSQVSYDHRSSCLNCVHCCDDHSSLDFKSAVQYMEHFICHFTVITVSRNIVYPAMY